MTLKDFLKEKRVLTKFRANYRTIPFRMHKLTKKEAEKYILEKAYNANGICSAFDWSATPEGLDYWRVLDKEWTIICNKK